MARAGRGDGADRAGTAPGGAAVTLYLQDEGAQAARVLRVKDDVGVALVASVVGAAFGHAAQAHLPTRQPHSRPTHSFICQS